MSYLYFDVLCNRFELESRKLEFNGYNSNCQWNWNYYTNSHIIYNMSMVQKEKNKLNKKL